MYHYVSLRITLYRDCITVYHYVSSRSHDAGQGHHHRPSARRLAANFHVHQGGPVAVQAQQWQDALCAQVLREPVLRPDESWCGHVREGHQEARRAVTCRIVSYHTCITLYHAVSRCIMLYHASSCCIMLYHAVSCCIMLYHAVSCCIMLYHAVSCCILLYLTVSCGVSQVRDVLRGPQAAGCEDLRAADRHLRCPCDRGGRGG